MRSRCLSWYARDKHRIITLHTITRAPTIIGKAGPLAGKVIAMQNDVSPAEHMSMRTIQDEDGLFETTDEAYILIPKPAAVEVQFASTENAGNDLLKPMPKRPDSEEVTTYMCCPVPLELLRLSVDKLYAPKPLYDKSLQWTTDQGLKSEDQPYLKWLGFLDRNSKVRHAIVRKSTDVFGAT